MIMRTPYIDAHLHLQDQRFHGSVEAIITRAKKAGVRRLFCNAVTEADWSVILELANTNLEIVPFLGLHPWFSDKAKPGWQDRLIKFIKLTDTLKPFTGGAGIGETGLDKSCSVDFGVQRDIFLAHLELGVELNLPVSIHCVRAWGTLVDMLGDFGAKKKLPLLMIHSFTGSVEIMKRLTKLGCFISYSEALVNPDQKKLSATFKQTPLSLLLLETDAPFKKNPYHQNHDFNEPADVVGVYQFAADLLSLKQEDFSSQIWDNAAIFTNQDATRR